MDNAEKNAPIIKELERKSEEIGAVLNYFRSNHNNRESSLVCTKLQEAIHWIDDYIKSLK